MACAQCSVNPQNMTSTVELPPRPVVYAHRGSMVLAPENTAIAFDIALGFAADVLEIDVRLSRDGIVMVFHDERLDRTTNGSGRVCDWRASEITNLDAGHRFIDIHGKDWTAGGARVCTLQELFARYPDIHVNIDIKDRSDKAADTVALAIEHANRENSVTVGSFHAATLLRFRERSPGVTTAASHIEVARLYFGRWTRNAASPKKNIAYQYLQIPTRWWGLPLDRQAFIDAAHANNVRTVYWTINESARMHYLQARGVYGIVTDRPDLANEAFGNPE